MTTNNNYRTWLTNWQSAATFSDLPSIPGLLAISTNRRDEVIYITKLAQLRTAEACTCQFGNVAALLQVKNLRFISAGGKLRNYFRFLDANPNMVHALDLDNQATGDQYMDFEWDETFKKYIATTH